MKVKDFLTLQDSSLLAGKASWKATKEKGRQINECEIKYHYIVLVGNIKN